MSTRERDECRPIFVAFRLFTGSTATALPPSQQIVCQKAARLPFARAKIVEIHIFREIDVCNEMVVVRCERVFCAHSPFISQLLCHGTINRIFFNSFYMHMYMQCIYSMSVCVWRNCGNAASKDWINEEVDRIRAHGCPAAMRRMQKIIRFFFVIYLLHSFCELTMIAPISDVPSLQAYCHHYWNSCSRCAMHANEICSTRPTQTLSVLLQAQDNYANKGTLCLQ